MARYGATGDLNYALGRVDFFNPITGGFVTEAEHVTATNRFLAPMDQTHTLTAGATYVHRATGLRAGATMEYGSGTPMGHGGAGHEHAPGEADHTHAQQTSTAPRIPGHITANLCFGWKAFPDAHRGPRLSFQLDIENVTDNTYRIAQEGEFSPPQFAAPRLIAATARIHF